MKDSMKERFIKFIVWRMPPTLLLWAVIRAFAEVTSGKYGNRHVDEVPYKMVYDTLVEKYKLRGF